MVHNSREDRKQREPLEDIYDPPPPPEGEVDKIFLVNWQHGEGEVVEE